MKFSICMRCLNILPVLKKVSEKKLSMSLYQLPKGTITNKYFAIHIFTHTPLKILFQIGLRYTITVYIVLSSQGKVNFTSDSL